MQPTDPQLAALLEVLEALAEILTRLSAVEDNQIKTNDTLANFEQLAVQGLEKVEPMLESLQNNPMLKMFFK